MKRLRPLVFLGLALAFALAGSSCGAGAAAALYGVYAFVRNQIPAYLFLRAHFVFFDFERPAALFFADYLAMMALFVFLAHWLSSLLRPAAPGANAAK